MQPLSYSLVKHDRTSNHNNIHGILYLCIPLASGLSAHRTSHFISAMQPIAVADPTILYTRYGDKVDEAYAADLRQKTTAPKASATSTVRNSKGDEITGDYALALRKSLKRQVQLEKKRQ